MKAWPPTQKVCMPNKKLKFQFYFILSLNYNDCGKYGWDNCDIKKICVT